MQSQATSTNTQYQTMITSQLNGYYPLVIIGTGPAGYTASIYASRYKIKHLLIGNVLGGQVSKAVEIENYPGFISIKGYELAMKFKEHAEHFMPLSNSNLLFDKVNKIQRHNNATGGEQSPRFTVYTDMGSQIATDSIILTIGVKKRTLNVPGEAKFTGKGVSLCTTCDGFFYRGKTVGVVGGGDSAATSALYLADICPTVYLFVRRDVMRAEPMWQEQIKNKPNIKILFKTEVAEIYGNDRVQGVKTKDGRDIKLEGLFIEIGHYPDTTLTEPLGIGRDEEGYIKVKGDMSTNIPGIFAAGDVTTANNKFKQIAIAIGEGAVAANSAFMWLQKNK